MAGMKHPGEGMDEVTKQARNYIYDLSALATVFNTGSYEIDAVMGSLEQYSASVEAQYGHLGSGVAVMTRFPGMDRNINLREVIAELSRDFEAVYDERQPYIVACMTYFVVMQQVQWNLARFLEVIEQNVGFHEGIDSGEHDGEAFKAEVEASMPGVSFDMYKAAYQKLHEELEVVRGILERCKGQIRGLDALLAQEKSGLGGHGGYVH